MTTSEHKALLDKILSATGDEKRAEVSGYLLSLETDYKEQLAGADAAKTQIESLEKQNKDYAEVNTRLFLERQNVDTKGVDVAEEKQAEETVQPDKLSYDDLVF